MISSKVPCELQGLAQVKIRGKDNHFKDVSVTRQKLADALSWLINNNPHYKSTHTLILILILYSPTHT